MKISTEDHRLLALWAAECAEHVLPYYEQVYSDDNRPRLAIEAVRTWVKEGMDLNQIRFYSLGAHAAARDAQRTPARLAARAAGQAVATAHAVGHAVHAADYAAAAAEASGDTGEHDWQYERLPKHLRKMVFPK